MEEPLQNQSCDDSFLIQGFSSSKEPIQPIKEPSELCLELKPEHYAFAQPSSSLSAGIPNKEFHSPLVEQQLITCQKFEAYCRENLYFKHPKDIGGQLEKMLSYRSKNLSHAMLKYAEEFLKEESDFSFRCLLKIVG